MKQTTVIAPMKPWEPLNNESAKAFRAFVLFREWPYLNENENRSISKVAKEIKSHPNTVQGWASKHDWHARVKAYDEFMLSRVDESVRQEFIDRLEEQMRIILAMRGRGIQALQRIKPEALSPQQALLYLEKSIKLEQELIRLSNDLGLTTEREEQQEEPAVIILPAKEKI